jgi:hypothetical protein
MRRGVMMRIVLCEDAHKLLHDFIYRATASWSSGHMADLMLYSEPELLYRVALLDDAMQEADAIYKPQWIQLVLDGYL